MQSWILCVQKRKRAGKASKNGTKSQIRPKKACISAEKTPYMGGGRKAVVGGGGNVKEIALYK